MYSPDPGKSTRSGRLPVERRLGDWMRARLPLALADFVMFGLKQAWACLFGGLMLALLIVTKLVWQEDWQVARYDFLLLAALMIQFLLLTFRLESWREARVILLFHVTGTAMEIFKIEMGSWAYPEPGFFKIADVPLFSGFMYASVGSYMARVVRIFDMRFVPYPSEPLTWLLGAAIYLNFFWHHFGPDLRYPLMAATVVIYWRTWISFNVSDSVYRMPLVIAALLSTLFLFIAENVGTLTGTWIYAGNAFSHRVSIAKAGSWYLLLYVSFVQVALVHRDRLVPEKSSEGERST